MTDAKPDHEFVPHPKGPDHYTGCTQYVEGQYCGLPRSAHAAPESRSILFHRGFGDGAKCSAIKFPSQPDYIAGWEAGKKACEEACERYRVDHKLPPPLILRSQFVPQPSPTDRR